MMYNLIIEIYVQHVKFHVRLLFTFKCFRFGIYDFISVHSLYNHNKKYI